MRDGLSGPWSVLSTDSRAFVLQDDYVGMLTEDGELWFRVSIDGAWVKSVPSGAVTQFQMVATSAGAVDLSAIAEAD